MNKVESRAGGRRVELRGKRSESECVSGSSSSSEAEVKGERKRKELVLRGVWRVRGGGGGVQRASTPTSKR